MCTCTIKKANTRRFIIIIGVGVQFDHSKKKFGGDGFITLDIEDVKGYKSRSH